MYPNFLLLDVGDDLTSLKNSIRSPELPTIDEDAVLSCLIDTLRNRITFSTDLYYFKESILNGDVICGIKHYEDYVDSSKDIEQVGLFNQFKTIASTAGDTAKNIFDQICRLRLYQEDYFNYEYDSNVANKYIIVRRIPD